MKRQTRSRPLRHGARWAWILLCVLAACRDTGGTNLAICRAECGATSRCGETDPKEPPRSVSDLPAGFHDDCLRRCDNTRVSFAIFDQGFDASCPLGPEVRSDLAACYTRACAEIQPCITRAKQSFSDAWAWYCYEPVMMK